MSKKKTIKGSIDVKAIDALIAERGHSVEAILGEEGLLAELTKVLVERNLKAMSGARFYRLENGGFKQEHVKSL